MAARCGRLAVACALALALLAAGAPAAGAYRFNDGAATQTGPEQVVFDWGDDQTAEPTGARPRCAEDDIPDTPARAYRDATGKVVLMSSHFTPRRFVGTSFDALQHPCNVLMQSGNDMDPAAFDDHEWITSPFTPDGTNVYALVHEEYQGWRDDYGNSCSGVWLELQKCWRNTITLASSANGGASFSSPGSVVAGSPYRFRSGIGPYGYFKPSNIVHAADGFYYSMIRSLGTDSTPAQPDGVCLIRTNNLASAGSWRAWDGTGFNVSFIDPYTQSGSPAAHVCAVVDSKLLNMSSSLVYSEYLHRYVLIDLLAIGPFSPNPADRAPGVYYSTSADLIHWSSPRLLMESEVTESFACGEQNPIRVPALIDHTSSSRNFDTMGADADLYFTRSNMIYNDDGSCYLGFDRDLVRIPIRFDKPATPAVTGVFPIAPTNNNNSPRVRGTAPAGMTVKLYSNSTCTGPALGSAPANIFGSSGIQVPVPDDSTTTFHATAVDIAEVPSDCSSTSATYVEDSTPPDPPTVTLVAPAIGNNNAPRVKGTAAAGAIVKVFDDDSCGGAPLGSAIASTFATAGVPASAPDDSTTTFHASATDAAGNTSACSTTSVTYVEDSTPPPAPTLTTIDPASLADANEPVIVGAAAPGSTVELFAAASCTGTPIMTGSASAFASPGFAVSVPDDSTTRFSATATDVAGNVSSCSPALTYVEETTHLPPEPPAPNTSIPSAVTFLGNASMPDRLAPRMVLGAKVASMGRTGIVRLRLRCPSSEPDGCKGTVRLATLGGERRFAIRGGAAGTITLRLAKGAQRRIIRSGQLRTVATIKAHDQAGNARTEKVKLVLKAPAGKRNL